MKGVRAVVVNRTVGTTNVVPELVYPDVGKAVDWLCAAFGFEEMWRVGNHRARIRYGNGMIAVADAAEEHGRRLPGAATDHGVMLQVEDIDSHHARARDFGAHILSAPTDFPFGERQYTVEDLAGHRWIIGQSIADVAPEDWGGTSA